MRKLHSRLAPLLLAFALATLDGAAAQRPFALLHSLFDPGTNAQEQARQGWSVAIDGNIAVVGAPFDDVGGYSSGVVKVYNATTGGLLHTLINPSPANNDNFGFSVAIAGTRVAVGTPNDNTVASQAGRVYVYDLTGATPQVPIVTLNNPSPGLADSFGYCVAIAGTRVVIGAFGDDAEATRGGSAYVYDMGSLSPTLPVATLFTPVEGEPDNFGYAVAISGTRVLVGAP